MHGAYGNRDPNRRFRMRSPLALALFVGIIVGTLSTLLFVPAVAYATLSGRSPSAFSPPRGRRRCGSATALNASDVVAARAMLGTYMSISAYVNRDP